MATVASPRAVEAAEAAACTAASRDGRFFAGCALGQVWLLERLPQRDGTAGPKWRRSLLGDFELASAVPMTVRLVEAAGRTFCFAGVMRQTQRALKVWCLDFPAASAIEHDLEPGLAQAGSVGSCDPQQPPAMNRGGAPDVLPRELTLNNPKDGKLRGFGSVAVCENANSTDQIVSFRVACGLGIGKAHLWRFTIDLQTASCAHVHEGSVVPRQNSISALALSEDAKHLVTVTVYDSVQQLWSLNELVSQDLTNPFLASSRLGPPVTREVLEPLFDGPALTRLDAVDKAFRDNQLKGLRRLLASDDATGWKLLFPLENLSEGEEPADEADDEIQLAELWYEGELNSKGEPDGYGTQILFESISTSQVADEAEKVHLQYSGGWERGKRCGFGTLRREDTGVLVYEGMWQDGLRHGTGKMILTDYTYDGAFERDQRHGFGVLQVMRSCAISVERGPSKGKKQVRARSAGEAYHGFWLRDEPHGVGRWTFPARCSKLNSRSPDEIAHLGKIRCFVVHDRGVLLRELLFHRADGGAIQPEDQALLEAGPCKFRNFDLSLPGALVQGDEEPGTWFSCGRCWRCVAAGGAHAVTCRQCSFTVHTRCLPEDLATSCPCGCVPGVLEQGGSSSSSNSSSSSSSSSGPSATKEELDYDACVRAGAAGAAGVKGGSSNSDGEKPKSSKRGSRGGTDGSRTGGSAGGEPASKAKKRQRTQEDKADAAGAQAARKTVRALFKQRILCQAKFYKAQIQSNRKVEIRKRKGWNADKEAEQAALVRLELDLQERQHVLATERLQLSRLQGQDLRAMQVSELSRLQEAVEGALDVCRQALEAAASGVCAAAAGPSAAAGGAGHA